MSWGWSHDAVAYENARRRLGKLSLPTLMCILAEWRATYWEDAEVMVGPDLDLDTYEDRLAALKAEDARRKQLGIHHSTRREDLADCIWEFAEQLRTCTNGGHKAWACPYGCGPHLVSFGD